MKKIIAFTFALVFLLSLTACGDDGNTRNSSAAPPASSLAPDTSVPPAPPPAMVLPRVTGDADSDFSHTEVIENISVDITASNAYLLNINTNFVLYEKNCKEQIAPASTAKMLTALTVLDYCDLDDRFTVGPEIDLIAFDSSRAGLTRGDTLTVKQLLVAMLLPSGNDAAYTLAVNTGKKIAGEDGLSAQEAVKVFAGAMNRKSKEAGAASSNFVTPDGYDAQGQYTTAFDLAQIAKACLDNDALTEIMGSYKIDDAWISGREVTYLNTNELINPNSPYYYSSAIGLKTGTTGEAGACIVSAAAINGQVYICVVMGSSAEVRFSDCLAVFSAVDPTIALPKESDAHPSIAPGGLRRR